MWEDLTSSTATINQFVPQAYTCFNWFTKLNSKSLINFLFQKSILWGPAFSWIVFNHSADNFPLSSCCGSLLMEASPINTGGTADCIIIPTHKNTLMPWYDKSSSTWLSAIRLCNFEKINPHFFCLTFYCLFSLISKKSNLDSMTSKAETASKIPGSLYKMWRWKCLAVESRVRD